MSPGGARPIAGPHRKEHRPLENESVPVGRATQAIEQTLRSIPDQDILEVLAKALDILEPLPNRCGEVFRRCSRHATRASMYGRMTRHTRHAFAAAVSSSIWKRRARQPSRSASRATSRPTLFLNLKQSATVLAGL